MMNRFWLMCLDGARTELWSNLSSRGRYWLPSGSQVWSRWVTGLQRSWRSYGRPSHCRWWMKGEGWCTRRRTTQAQVFDISSRMYQWGHQRRLTSTWQFRSMALPCSWKSQYYIELRQAPLCYPDRANVTSVPDWRQLSIFWQSWISCGNPRHDWVETLILKMIPESFSLKCQNDAR